ncbi:MAG: hypothetical protein M1386_01645 [Candidatus Thermoplasmatota archaeon]|jgi:Ribonuclease G/E|nr:hypothetical protein [Candidatus Thermoplasmatota archaeon]
MVGNGQNEVGNGGKDLTNLVNSIPNPNEISDKNDNNGIVSTRKKIADELVVGEGTVERMEYIMKKADEGAVEKEILEAFRGGEKSVSKVYSDLKENEAAKMDTTEKEYTCRPSRSHLSP